MFHVKQCAEQRDAWRVFGESESAVARVIAARRASRTHAAAAFGCRAGRARPAASAPPA